MAVNIQKSGEGCVVLLPHNVYDFFQNKRIFKDFKGLNTARVVSHCSCALEGFLPAAEEVSKY